RGRYEEARDGGDREAARPDDQGQTLRAVHFIPQLVADAHRPTPWKRSRSSGVGSGIALRSPVVACWLNCKARMNAAIRQRSSTDTREAYEYMAPCPFVITPKKCPTGACRRSSYVGTGLFKSLGRLP